MNPIEEQTAPAESKGTGKKWFYGFFFSILIVFIVFLIADQFSKDDKPFVDIATPDIVPEIPAIESDVYLLETSKDLLSDDPRIADMMSTTISGALGTEEPSIFIVSYDELDPRFDRVYQDLLYNNHAVLFIGKNLDPEKVVSFFAESKVPVVPIEGTLPTYFQIYGAVYSKQAEAIVPVFFSTNETKKFSTDGLLRTLASLNGHLAQ